MTAHQQKAFAGDSFENFLARGGGFRWIRIAEHRNFGARKLHRRVMDQIADEEQRFGAGFYLINGVSGRVSVSGHRRNAGRRPSVMRDSKLRRVVVGVLIGLVVVLAGGSRSQRGVFGAAG